MRSILSSEQLSASQEVPSPMEFLRLQMQLFFRTLVKPEYSV
jgi:hypothetical protein